MLEYMTQCRRDLHRIPELEQHLPETCAYVKAQLAALSCTVLEPTEGSVCAYFDEGKAETAAFRADMDALPGDGGNGSALRLAAPGADARLRPRRPHCPAAGLCPAGGGAAGQSGAECAADFSAGRGNPRRGSPPVRERHFGALPRFPYLRPSPLPGLPAGEIYTRPGPMMAKSSEIDVTFRGKSVHISRWREGADSLLAAAEYLRRVYDMEAREFPPETARLLRFGRAEGGVIRNAVAAETVLRGTLRAFTLEDFDFLRRRCGEIAAETAAEHGCTASAAFSEGYPPVTNDPALLARIEAQLGKNGPKRYAGLALTTEDFAWYQQYVPGVFFFLGVGDTAELHSPRFTFDEQVLEQGLALYEKLLDLK